MRLTDLHRPFIDELTRPNPDDPTGRSTMRRVPEVLDCWFESGSMPYAQVHYPFENREWFEHHNPGDFIVEYNGQTRGWFYTMHVLATALFDRPAFRTCVAHGIVLGDDGQKMSKSRRNYPDVGQVFERDGSDAMRWFLMSSPILRGADLVVTEAGIREGVRQALLPLWNTWSFLALYAGASSVVGRSRPADESSDDVLDRYILAKTAELRDTLTAQLDAFDIAGACATLRGYLEVLTNWYIRRSRERFWADDQNAFDTLHTVLEVVCRLTAPLLPLTTEVIWQGLTGGRSVHLTDWPAADELPHDEALVAAMDAVRDVASVALSVRKAEKLRVRQPLAAMTVAVAEPAALEPFAALLADEVNVRSVVVEAMAEDDARVTRRLTVNARAAGPRLGKQVQQVIKASKAGDWSVTDDGAVVCGGIALTEGEFTLELAATGGSAAIGLLRSGGFVALETALDDDLVAEGIVRDVVRGVQDVRKQIGLQVSDRIRLTVTSAADVVTAAVSARQDWLAEQVLAGDVAVVAGDPAADVAGTAGSAFVTVGTGVDAPVRVSVERI